MSLSLIKSFQECAGTTKLPATWNIFLCHCPGVGEHLESKRQFVQWGYLALGPCNGGWRKRILLSLAWSNNMNWHFRVFVVSVRLSCLSVWESSLSGLCPQLGCKLLTGGAGVVHHPPMGATSWALRDTEDASQDKSGKEITRRTGVSVCSGAWGWTPAGPSSVTVGDRAQDC